MIKSLRGGKKTILFFPINGSGLGHLTRCLAYARKLKPYYKIFFFSLCNAIERIEEEGFEADYFISPFWSDNSATDWNSELTLRLGLILQHIRPQALVFDGTWPFRGLRLAHCNYPRRLKMVWSRRGLLKNPAPDSAEHEKHFDLVLTPGEIGTRDISIENTEQNVKHIIVPPVTALDNTELLSRQEARKKLGLRADDKIVIFSLGPGNLKDVSSIGHKLISRFHLLGYRIAWLQSPISTHDLELPSYVIPVSSYPVVRYLKAFDCVVSAAGYNSCSEIAQTGIPALIVPNELVVDDQLKRAGLLARVAPVVITDSSSDEIICNAVSELLTLVENVKNGKFQARENFVGNGAQHGARAIADLCES